MKGFKSCFAAALMGLVIFSAGLNASAAEERVIVEDNCDNFENPAIANLTDG